MIDNRSISSRYTGSFLMGCFLFSYPCLTLFNHTTVFLGVPVFFLYLFTAWAFLIISIPLVMKILEVTQPYQETNQGE